MYRPAATPTAIKQAIILNRADSTTVVPMIVTLGMASAIAAVVTISSARPIGTRPKLQTIAGKIAGHPATEADAQADQADKHRDFQFGLLALTGLSGR